MTLPVFIRRNQKSRGSIRGTICSPGSRAISGMAHSDISFSGDPRIKSLQKPKRGVFQSFHTLKTSCGLSDAHASHQQPDRRRLQCPTRVLKDLTK